MIILATAGVCIHVTCFMSVASVVSPYIALLHKLILCMIEEDHLYLHVQHMSGGFITCY